MRAGVAGARWYVVRVNAHQEPTKAAVHDFWEAEPCGSIHSDAPEGSREFFDDIERQRYEAEPFIHDFADFAATRGKKVLEIGVREGTDHVNFARAGTAGST